MNVRHVAVVCAAAGLLLAACSSSAKVAITTPTPRKHSAIDAEALIAAAPGVTSQLKTAREVTTVTSTMSGIGTFFSSTGLIDFATGQAEVTSTIAGLTEQTIVDGTTSYLSLPASPGAPAAKPWVKVTAADLTAGGQAGQSGQAGQNPLSSMFPSGTSNPANGLDILAGVSGTVTTVGTEKVGGVSSTHYRFTADLSKAMQDITPGNKDSLKQLEEGFGVTAPTVDVWIDGSGVVRRISFAEDLNLNLGALAGAAGATPPPGIGTTMSGTVISTTDFNDFGVPVTITDPPASQVTTPSEMERLSGNG